MPKLAYPIVSGFHGRFAEALRRRLYPNSTIHLKQLAAAIQKSEHTVSRWWHGESRPLAEDIDRMAAFFALGGDRDFLRAVFGGAAGPAETISDERLLQFLRPLLAGGGRIDAGDDRHLWFTADGTMEIAAGGHAAFAAATLGIGSSGDLVRYATSLLGWIAISVQPDDVVVIRHDGRRVAQLAAERACEWLRARRRRTALVRRVIRIEGRLVDAAHDSAEQAASALEKIAFIVRLSRRPWQVKRLSLNEIGHPRLAKLIEVHRQNPDRIINAAAIMGALGESGVFSVDGESVVSLQAPTKYRDLDPRLIEGKNVLSRPDTDYAVMVWARMINAKRDGAIYHELSGSVNNFHVHYVNLTLVEPGPHGRVLSSSALIDLEPIAA